MTKATAAEKVVDFDGVRSAEQVVKDIPVLSEDHIATKFVDLNQEAIRFDHTRKCWFAWIGNKWQRDDTGSVEASIRSVVRAIASDQSSGDRKRLGARKVVSGVEGLARIDERISVTRKRWDENIEALGTPDGYVDLRSGELFEPDPELFITKSVAVVPDIATDCPRWLQFLNQLTNGDDALKKFLQQWAGYCLTGETVEQKLIFIHGPGGTGKTTFAYTLRRIMADYATAAAMETFTNSTFDRHPEQIARLDGMRMVVASETEAGHRWRQSRVKLLTGGDEIVGNFMRENSFVFKPEFKLVFVGNHAPSIANLDSAIQRRFLVVPFLHKPVEPDLYLEETLAEEFPGILRWMINGAADWHARKLIVPKSVSEATTRYFDEQDVFGQWLEECCEVDLKNDVLLATTKELFASWSNFAQSHGETVGNQAVLNANLRGRGLDPKQIKSLRTTGCRYIRLKLDSRGYD